MFRDLAILASALVAVTFIAYVWTIDWRGAIPRDGTTLAVGRDFLNLWMHGRAAAISDPGQFYDLATIIRRSATSWAWSSTARTDRTAQHHVAGRALRATELPRSVCMLDADRLMTIFAWLDRKPIAAGVLMMLALFPACSVSASPYLLAYDLLPLTFAAIALLACASLDAPGRRLVQLVYWSPILQFALGTHYLPGPALIAPAFAVYLLMRLRVSAGVQVGFKKDIIFRGRGVFEG
jgi:hypothetical protein